MEMVVPSPAAIQSRHVQVNLLVIIVVVVIFLGQRLGQVLLLFDSVVVVSPEFERLQTRFAHGQKRLVVNLVMRRRTKS